MKRLAKPLIAQVADDLHSAQYIVRVAGCVAAISFTPAEEARVKAKTVQFAISVEQLIERTAMQRLGKSRRSAEEAILHTVKVLGASAKKRKGL